MAQNVVSISASGTKTEISAVTAIGFTPINKAGDTGVGNLTMSSLTATSVALSTPAFLTVSTGTTAATAFRVNSTGAEFYFGTESSVAGSYYPGSAAYATVIYTPAHSLDFITDSGARFVTTAGGKSAVTAGAITSTTHKVTSAAGYISSDGSTGYTGTVTTASLVGKTLTIKDGIITGFA